MRVAVLTFLAGSGLFALGGCEGDTGTEISVEPPILSVVEDTTRSNQQFLPLQAKIVARFVRENALSGGASIHLIKMDREPEQIDYFPAQKLLDGSAQETLKRLTYTTKEDGTDVVTALEKARDKLNKGGKPASARRILLVFSDMHVDAATTPTLRKFRSLSEFDWASLKGVECHFYFVDSKSGLDTQVQHFLDFYGVQGEALDQAESRRISLPNTSEE